MSRRLPLEPEGRRQRTDPSFQAGSTRGRIGNASPVGDGGGRGRVRPTSPGNTGPGGGVQFFDQFDTVALVAAGAQSKTLTYLPIPFSEHVFLNGLRQTRGAGADFTITGQTLNVLVGMDARVGDTLAIEYAYAGAVPISVSQALVSFGSGGWKYLQVASGDAVDRSAVAFDDSTWAVGAGAFGADTGSADLEANFRTYATAWTTQTRLWIRRSLGASITSAVVRFRADDSIQVSWNGAIILAEFSNPTPNNLATPRQVAVPTLALGGTNVLAVRGTDTPANPVANRAYLDIEVVGS